MPIKQNLKYIQDIIAKNILLANTFFFVLKHMKSFLKPHEKLKFYH